MSTLAVFPFSIDTMPLLRGCSLTEYKQIYPINPFIPDLYDQDACFIDRGPQTYTVIEKNFEKGLSQCSSILFTHNPVHEHTENIYSDAIKQAFYRKKHVLITPNLFDALSYEVKSICKQGHILQWNEDEPKVINRRLYNINVPVILILGSGYNCNKFDLLLAIRACMTKMGYKVYQLGTKSYSSVFGFSTLPSFLFREYNVQDKVLMFNHYLSSEIERHNPDMCILAAPGGISTIYDKIPDANSNIYSYIMSSATHPDLLIRSLYVDSYSDEFIQKDQDYCQFYVKQKPDIYHIANVIAEKYSGENGSINYYYTNYSSAMTTATQELDENLPFVCQSYDKDSIAYACKYMISRLF